MKIAVFLLLILLLSSPLYAEKYADGVFEGSDGFVKVSVAIENGKIKDVEILKHRPGGEKYEKMITPLTDEVIKKQSSDVDAVTGATTSSKYFKKAVQNALDKSASFKKKERIMELQKELDRMHDETWDDRHR